MTQAEEKKDNVDELLKQQLPEGLRKAFDAKIKEMYDDKKIKEIRMQVFDCIARGKKDEATEIVVNEFMQNNRVFTIRHDEKPEMWIYHKGIYIPQARTFINEYIRVLMNQAFTTHMTNIVVSKIQADTYIDAKEFFKEDSRHRLPVLNGILDLHTKKLYKFTDQRKFFTKIPVWYDPRKECPNILKFLSDVTKTQDDMDVLQEWFGYILYREYFVEKALMLEGGGRNGKSKTIELMMRLIGTESCTNIDLQDLLQNQYSVCELHTKLANFGSDIGRGMLSKTNWFKKLTGRDTISAARKFMTPLEFENYAKLIFASNEMPLTSDETFAFFDRWVVITFPYTFVTQKQLDEAEDKSKLKLRDPGIIEKITSKEELSGLLNWALEGLHRLIENRDFGTNESTEDVKRKWIRKSNSLAAFCEDMIERENDGYISKEIFRRSYNSYCNEHNLRPCSDKFLKEYLTVKWGVYDKKVSSGNERQNVWAGIAFKNVYKENGQSVQAGKDVKGKLPLEEFANSPKGEKPLTELTPWTPEEIDMTKTTTLSRSTIYKELEGSPTGMTHTELYSKFTDHPEDKFEDLIKVMLSDGTLYEPTKGTYKIIT